MTENSKSALNLVVIGHVDSGKSTVIGQLLLKLGIIGNKEMHKHKSESSRIGKGSFYLAWSTDETSSERSRGITMDISVSHFETPNFYVNIIDSPGHKDLVSKMITGASQADAGLIVIDSSSGAFEIGISENGQTQEHCRLIRALGITQAIVLINKIDMSGYSSERYYEIVNILEGYFKKSSFNESSIIYVPCSGINCDNIVESSEKLKWYNGPTLLKALDMIRLPERSLDKPFRLSISASNKGQGKSVVVIGKVETGSVNINQKVLCLPRKTDFVVKYIGRNGSSSPVGVAGDFVELELADASIDDVPVGSILCCKKDPCILTKRFICSFMIFKIFISLLPGMSLIFHMLQANCTVRICSLVSLSIKGQNEPNYHPRYIPPNSLCELELEFSDEFPLDLFSYIKQTGRFILRHKSSTVGVGIVTKFL